jgi:L-ascorbate metabolism protein UlaG (beta-lactamase superfamily)
MSSLYLRPNVQLEPLVDQWYAWTYLIPPATAARNLTERNFPIMTSFIASPEVHSDAVKNPKMRGGPFVDYDRTRVDEVSALLNTTRTNRSNLVALSAAIAELDALLRNEARGQSLHALYPKIPAALRGFVELVYDRNSNPSFRVIEPLLYRSSYYVPHAQSVMLSLLNGDDRPFVLSTPRLESGQSIHLKESFASSSIDWLVQLKKSPQPRDEIFSRIGVDKDQQSLFQAMLTEEQPPPYKPYAGAGIRWRYFGHACILIEAAGLCILCDPVLSYTYESDVSRYTYDDLPDRIDFVLITHNHQDHILFETLLQIRHKVGTFIVPRSGGGSLQDPSLRLLLEMVGFKNVMELGELDEIRFDAGVIVGIPFLGEHADLDVRSKLGYLVRLQGRSVLLLADSCNIDPMMYQHLSKEIHDCDVLFIGMECDGAPLTWLYGPLLTQKPDRTNDLSRRLSGSNYEQAISIVECFKPAEAYIYAMGQEPWLNYIMSIKYSEQSRPIVESNRFVQECNSRGVRAERLFGEKEILI